MTITNAPRSFALAAACAIAIGSLSALAPSSASAQYLYAGGSPGVSINFINTNNNNVTAFFVIREEFGVHPMGDAQGFFVGLALGQHFNSDLWYLVFSPRLGYDIEIIRTSDDSFAFQLGPFAQLPGLALINAFQSWGGPTFFFDMIFGMDVRILLLQRLLTLFVRPFGFDFAFTEGPNVFVSWEAVAGVFVNF